MLVDQLVAFMSVGGPVVWILTCTSVVALAIILVKVWQFITERPESSEAINRCVDLWESDKRQEAIDSLGQQDFATSVLAAVIQGIVDDRLARAPLLDEVERVVNASLAEFRTMLPILEVIGTLSPLLGLFGIESCGYSSISVRRLSPQELYRFSRT